MAIPEPMHDILHHEYFTPLVGKTLAINSHGKPIGELKLESVDVLSRHDRHESDDIRAQPFSLLFTSAPELKLTQGMVDFSLSSDRVEPIFIVPLGPTPDRRWKYEAVFN